METEEIVVTSGNDITTSSSAEVGQRDEDEAEKRRGETAASTSNEPNVEQGLNSGTSPIPVVENNGSGDNKNNDKTGTGNNNNNNNEDSTFECNICLDTARNAVISMCGHLFCWSCVHQWLETRPNKQVCPVCKSAIGRDKVIPLYGRNGDQKDPRDSAPPRPQGQRSEPTNTVFSSFNMAGIGGENGFQFSFGIGAFPFALFATAFNFGERRPPAPAHWTQQYEAERTLHNTFICVAVLFMVWLLLA